MYIPCDVCGSGNPAFLLTAATLDGPLVECRKCGLKYVGKRSSDLTFGAGRALDTAEKVKQANMHLRHLRLDEERRLAVLNSRWRLDLIRSAKPAGALLEIGCARGDFLREAKQYFDARGVEPNPELADFAEGIAPVHRGLIEEAAWTGFDVIASFHVIEHVDSPRRFIAAAADRLKPGGLLVIETPNIASWPFRLLKSKWRQFIPEHYFFFDPHSMARLLESHALRTDRVISAGKHASMELIVNRLSRYLRWLPDARGLSRLTFRVNPMDIMLVFATKQRT